MIKCTPFLLKKKLIILLGGGSTKKYFQIYFSKNSLNWEINNNKKSFREFFTIILRGSVGSDSELWSERTGFESWRERNRSALRIKVV